MASQVLGRRKSLICKKWCVVVGATGHQPQNRWPNDIKIEKVEAAKETCDGHQPSAGDACSPAGHAMIAILVKNNTRAPKE